MNRSNKETLDLFLLDNATKFRFHVNGSMLDSIYIERRSLNNKSWVITDGWGVWSKSEYDFVEEPQASNRTDEFKKDTIFESVYDALDKVMELLK